jgi:hypothetical protein
MSAARSKAQIASDRESLRTLIAKLEKELGRPCSRPELVAASGIRHHYVEYHSREDFRDYPFHIDRSASMKKSHLVRTGVIESDSPKIAPQERYPRGGTLDEARAWGDRELQRLTSNQAIAYGKGGKRAL